MSHHPLRAAARRGAQILTAAAALAVLAALTGGLPWLLVTAIGWPLPHHLPHLHQIPQLLGSPLDDQTLLDALAVLAWIFWALFLRDLAVEILWAARDLAAHRRTGHRPTRPRRTGPVRLVAALLVGAIAGTLLLNRLSATTPRPTHPAAATSPPVATTAPLAPTPQAGPTASAADGATARPSRYVEPRPAATSLPATTATSSATSSAPSYTVVEGDNLWDIAGSHLGDPTRWREIYTLNRGHVQADGYALDDPDDIHIGWTLTLPTSPPEAPKAHPAPNPPDHRANGEKPPPAGSDVTPPQSTPDAGRPDTSPAPTSTRGRDVTGQDSSHPDGVHLPSGAWIGTGLAAALAATATTALLYRRRRTRLGWPVRPTTAATPSGVPRSLRAGLDAGIIALRTTGPAPVHPDEPAPQPDAVLGQDAAGNQIGLETLAGLGVALAGPGAPATVRAVLAAALTAGIPHDPSRRITVLTDTELLNDLLPDGNTPEGLDPRGQALDGERLLIRDHTDQAVTEFERELLYRQRILAQYDHDSPDQAAEGTAMVAAMGLTVLITTARPDQLARIRAVLDASTQLRLGAVLLGDAERFTTIDLNESGTITAVPAELPTPLARMASLGIRELADVLDLARAATAVVNEEPPPEDDRSAPDDNEPSGPAGVRPAALPTGSPRTALVRLTVLGPPAASTRNGSVHQITAGGHALLAYLAAHPPRRHPRPGPRRAVSRHRHRPGQPTLPHRLQKRPLRPPHRHPRRHAVVHPPRPRPLPPRHRGIRRRPVADAHRDRPRQPGHHRPRHPHRPADRGRRLPRRVRRRSHQELGPGVRHHLPQPGHQRPGPDRRDPGNRPTRLRAGRPGTSRDVRPGVRRALPAHHAHPRPPRQTRSGPTHPPTPHRAPGGYPNGTEHRDTTRRGPTATRGGCDEMRLGAHHRERRKHQAVRL